MSEICLLAINLAKNSFQVCGVRSDGVVVFNGSVSRARLVQLVSDQEPCVVAIEACATTRHRGHVGYGSRPRRTRDSSNLFEAFCEAPEEQLRGCGSHCRPVGGSVRSSARHPRVQAKKLLPSRDFRCETAIFGLQTQKALALQGGLVKR